MLIGRSIAKSLWSSLRLPYLDTDNKPAKQTSISLPTLVLAVFKTEQKLIYWMMERRRRELDLDDGGELDHLDEEDDEDDLY